VSDVARSQKSVEHAVARSRYTRTMECAGNNTIAALVAGAIDRDAIHALERHLDRCVDCRELVADLGRNLTAINSRLPRAGESIGRYEIHRVIGVGGMGVVYEARDAMLDRRVAVKLLRPDIADGSLLAEAQAMARLAHPNIAAVHDVGVDRDRLFLCMEYVDGTTLREHASRRWRDTVATYAAAGRGLAYIHRAGLVHLDFKPDNVLVDRDGRVVVTDFGLARMIGSRGVHGSHVVAGTPAYMAPEQQRNQPCDARADQYAFCAALSEALDKQHAPRWLRRAISRGLSPRPGDRFPTMDALLAAIDPSHRRSAVPIAAALVAAAIAAAIATTPRGDPLTREIDRPRIVERWRSSPSTSTGTVAFTSPTDPVPAPTSVAARASRRPTVAVPAFDRASSQPAFFAANIVSLAPDPLADAIDFVDDVAAALATGGECNDGTALACNATPPACPAATVVAIHLGCWTCADEKTCRPLGLPQTCNDGSRLTCSDQPPTCGDHQIARVRNGCWKCDDAFACRTRSRGPSPRPRPVPRPEPTPDQCYDEVCGPTETHTSCPYDCCELSGSGASCATTCGNGFCEIGEDHATCATDCCETTPTGACLPVCGNFFCESGEDHATCASDCCETTPSGGCVPVCGNGFCEIDEVCTADCE
jgi:predicted Ser/Thr protein kinase